jgi:putative sigma-54 modulation protein
MQIIVKGKDLKLTPSLKNYVEEKIGRIEKHLPQKVREVATAEVWLVYFHHHKKGKNSHCYVLLQVPEKNIRVQTSAEEMHAAIDLAYEKLERLVLKYKQKFDPFKNQDRFLRQKEFFKNLLGKLFKK